jgi:hypothetical protein
MARLARLFFLRGLRCNTKCGWRGFRFSRSELRRRKRSLTVTLFILLFILIAAAAVSHVISHAGLGASAAHDDGIQEVE